MLKTLLIKNWMSTLTGILGGLYLVIPAIQTWLQQTTHVTPMAVIALVLTVLGILTREKPSTAR